MEFGQSSSCLLRCKWKKKLLDFWKRRPHHLKLSLTDEEKSLTNYTDARHSIGTTRSHSHIFDDLMYSIRSNRYPETGAYIDIKGWKRILFKLNKTRSLWLQQSKILFQTSAASENIAHFFLLKWESEKWKQLKWIEN
jgi:hypothetical protein